MHCGIGLAGSNHVITKPVISMHLTCSCCKVQPSGVLAPLKKKFLPKLNLQHSNQDMVDTRTHSCHASD